MVKNKIILWIGIVFVLGATILGLYGKNMDRKCTKEEAVLENILNRKSVRRYVADKPVERETVEKLLRAAMSAPTGKDRRPWEFIVVDDREKLTAMAEKLPYAKMLPQASLAIVVCADERKSSYWYLDCSAAAQNILLAAEAMGLGAVWTATYPYEERMEVVTEVLGTPSFIRSLCVIPIGYPANEQAPKDKWDETRIHYNGY